MECVSSESYYLLFLRVAYHGSIINAGPDIVFSKTPLPMQVCSSVDVDIYVTDVCFPTQGRTGHLQKRLTQGLPETKASESQAREPMPHTPGGRQTAEWRV